MGIAAAPTTHHEPSRSELEQLHRRYARLHRRQDLRRLVEEYRGYANSLARRMLRGGEPLEDLEQVAAEGLVRALDRFEPERGIPFPAFARPTIVGSLKRHFRDLGWAVRVPRDVHELAGPLRRATDRLWGELGRSPSSRELAAALEVSVSAIDALQQATRARLTRSLAAPVGEDGLTVGDRLGAVDGRLALAEDRVALHRALDALDERDKDVLGRYFFLGQSQSVIADAFDVSQMQVSRWIDSSLRRLRSRMAAR